MPLPIITRRNRFRNIVSLSHNVVEKGSAKTEGRFILWDPMVKAPHPPFSGGRGLYRENETALAAESKTVVIRDLEAVISRQ